MVSENVGLACSAARRSRGSRPSCSLAPLPFSSNTAEGHTRRWGAKQSVRAMMSYDPRVCMLRFCVCAFSMCPVVCALCVLTLFRSEDGVGLARLRRPVGKQRHIHTYTTTYTYTTCKRDTRQRQTSHTRQTHTRSTACGPTSCQSAMARLTVQQCVCGHVVPQLHVQSLLVHEVTVPRGRRPSNITHKSSQKTHIHVDSHDTQPNIEVSQHGSTPHFKQWHNSSQ
jgi:hypothetical protein